MDQPNQNYRILLVEDDAALAAMIVDFLSPHGFDVSVEERGDAAVERIRTEGPDAVVLDIGLPGLDGFSVCRAVRPDFRGAILMLTARGDEVDEVLGLGAGADDYMAKPIRPRALLARLRVHLRKTTTADSDESHEPIRVGSLVVDPGRRQVKMDDVTLDLTSAEFDLLEYLARHAGRTVSRNDIHQHIHGFAYDGIDRSIDLRISRLRKKLGDDPEKPRRIKSVRGVGYLLSLDS